MSQDRVNELMTLLLQEGTDPELVANALHAYATEPAKLVSLFELVLEQRAETVRLQAARPGAAPSP